MTMPGKHGSRAAVLIGLIAFAAFANGEEPSSARAGAGVAENSSAAAQRISAADFGALPFMSHPKLSPDGKRVLTSAYLGGEKALAVIDLIAGSSASRRISVPDQYDLVWYRWAGDQRILMSVGRSIKYFGDDAYSTRLLAFDLGTNQAKFIGRREQGLEGDNVIHVDREGRWLLLSIQKTIYDYPSVWRVDLDTLDMKEVVRQWPGVWDWFADTSGTVRAGLGYQRRNWWLVYRKNEKDSFSKIIRSTLDADQEGQIEQFVPLDGSDAGYAIANTRTGRYGLYKYDFATDTIGEAIFEHAEVDIDHFHQSTAGEITAVYYTDDRSRIAWLDPKMKAVQAKIDQALPNRINRVVSFSRDDSKMLVWTGSASDPGAYYYYDQDQDAMKLLVRPFSKLSGKPLVPMESTKYAARDGLEIPAYLTLPRDVEPKALPLVIMPHGGPFLRDAWGYDVWAQFLASRGYAVLQPNFRGSTGYGRAFVEKGHGQWGRAMQDDLDDGVKWLVAQGKVDGKRVCIMGGSYGGYAALWAAARNPEIYRCAISFAGISDLAAMMRYDRRQFSATRYYRNWREKVQGEKAFDLDTVSPLYAAERINIPLLIAHGSEDEIVPMSQSKKLHEALAKRKHEHVYVIYEGEGHGFDSPENATNFLERVEQFLGTHNPAN